MGLSRGVIGPFRPAPRPILCLLRGRGTLLGQARGKGGKGNLAHFREVWRAFGSFLAKFGGLLAHFEPNLGNFGLFPVCLEGFWLNVSQIWATLAYIWEVWRVFGPFVAKFGLFLGGLDGFWLIF